MVINNKNYFYVVKAEGFYVYHPENVISLEASTFTKFYTKM